MELHKQKTGLGEMPAGTSFRYNGKQNKVFSGKMWNCNLISPRDSLGLVKTTLHMESKTVSNYLIF